MWNAKGWRENRSYDGILNGFDSMIYRGDMVRKVRTFNR